MYGEKTNTDSIYFKNPKIGRIIKQKIKLLLKTTCDRQIVQEKYSMSKLKGVI